MAREIERKYMLRLSTDNYHPIGEAIQKALGSSCFLHSDWYSSLYSKYQDFYLFRVFNVTARVRCWESEFQQELTIKRNDKNTIEDRWEWNKYISAGVAFSLRGVIPFSTRVKYTTWTWQCSVLDFQSVTVSLTIMDGTPYIEIEASSLEALKCVEAKLYKILDYQVMNSFYDIFVNKELPRITSLEKRNEQV